MLKYFIAVGLCLLSATTAVANSTNLTKPLVISTTVRGHGNVRVILNVERQFGVATNAKFYQGYYIRRGGQIPVAATYSRGKYAVVFVGKNTGSSGRRQRHYSVTFDNTLHQLRASSIPASALGEKACATDGTDRHLNHVPHVEKMVAQTVRTPALQITISTFADLEWYNLYGQDSNTKILSHINEAETLYLRQLNIRFKVVSQDFLPNLQEYDPRSLLQNFSKDERTFTTANVKYLFTGKDMTSNTIGIAYVGAICYAPKYSYGIVQSFGSLTSHVFAHELGHTLSASHDLSDYGNIMYPSISQGDSYFTANTIAQINTMINTYGQCIEPYLPPSPPVPAVLSLYRRGSLVYGTVYTETYQPISNQQVTVIINNIKTLVRTNVVGKYKLRFSARRGARVKVVARISPLRKQIKFKM